MLKCFITVTDPSQTPQIDGPTQHVLYGVSYVLQYEGSGINTQPSTMSLPWYLGHEGRNLLEPCG